MINQPQDPPNHEDLNTALIVISGVCAFLLTQHVPDIAKVIVGAVNAGSVAWLAKRLPGKKE